MAISSALEVHPSHRIVPLLQKLQQTSLGNHLLAELLDGIDEQLRKHCVVALSTILCSGDRQVLVKHLQHLDLIARLVPVPRRKS